MTRPTNTRTTLRRAVAMRLMMPFARRVAAGFSDATSGSTSMLFDLLVLSQPWDFWKGQWMFFPTTGEVRQILTSSPQTKGVQFEYPLAAAVSTGLDYEIHSVFNAIEIHEAINQAILSSYPSFFETVEDQSIVICEDKMEYDLTAITPAVGLVHEVALERPVNGLFTTVSSDTYAGGVETITLPAGTDLSPVSAGWYVSIYDGAGKGIAKVITEVNNTLKTVKFASATDPGLTSTSKCSLWDPNDQQLDWYRMKYVHFSSKEWPSSLRLYSPIRSYVGSRLRIKHSTMPSILSTEASTTVVPKEYIIAKAISILAGSRIGDNRVDRQRYAIMQDIYEKEAEAFKIQNFFRLPDSELFMEGRDSGHLSEFDPLGDPLGWR